MKPDLPSHLKTTFTYGTSSVTIRMGDLLSNLTGSRVDALVTAEDNYLTMQRGVSRQLSERLGSEYVRRAQESSPVRAGSVLVSDVSDHPSAGSLARFVYHAAVIDYDGGEKSLKELVSETSNDCLELAEGSGLRSIVFPALGTGSGGLVMRESAACMCSAIKTFLGQERQVKEITIVLHVPEVEVSAEEAEKVNSRLLDFCREANAIFDTPYDPQSRVSQSRDFYGREQEIRTLEALVLGEIPGKRHIAILGGANIGKWMLMNQLYYRSQKPESPLAKGRFFARVHFAPLIPSTDPAFLYRKLISAMLRHETVEKARQALRVLYADRDVNCAHFIDFIKTHQKRYAEVVFLLDGLPQGVEREEGDPSAGVSSIPAAVEEFFKDLDCLQEYVRFFFTSRSEESFRAIADRLKTAAPSFFNALDTMWVRSVSEVERAAWVKSIYKGYLGAEGEIPMEYLRFVEEEAGLHPYLISLACYAILNRMKRVALNSPQVLQSGWDRIVLRGIIELARKEIDAPRKNFFDTILALLPRQEALDLYNLCRAVVIEEQTRLLGPALAAGDPNAQARLSELMVQGDPRDLLHTEALAWLLNQGIIVRGSQGKEEPCARLLALYVVERMGGFRRLEDRPGNVTISLLHRRFSGKNGRGEKNTIRTLFNSRGARVISTEKSLSNDLRKAFMESFNGFLNARRGHSEEETGKHVFRNTEEIANFILSQFATLAVKRYLENPPPDCSINFLVDDELKDIPWELMLEAAYAGEIPFRVGRSIISSQPPANVRPPVRGPSVIKALLIANPTGDLISSEDEVNGLAASFRNNKRFGEPDILIGTDDCQRIRVLNALSSGRYGLVHYSGHSRYSGEGSAWVLSDGEVTADQLTSAAQAAPPAMLFSSSCFSAAGGVGKPVEYENQAFDLPGAFLGAGVEAYVGTLWEVDAEASRRLVERFYSAFLTGDFSIGECLRRARQSLKTEQERLGQTDWLAFVLYGDPNLTPLEIFPSFRN